MRSGDTRKQKSDHQIRSYWVHCFAQVLFDDLCVDQNTVNLWNTFLHCSKEQDWTYNLMSGIENTRDSFGPNPSVHTHRLWEAKGLGLSHCLLVKCRRVSLWRHFARQTSMYFCWLCLRELPIVHSVVTSNTHGLQRFWFNHPACWWPSSVYWLLSPDESNPTSFICFIDTINLWRSHNILQLRKD